MESPYEGKPVAEWPAITARLIEKHPLSTEEVVEVVMLSWDGIFETRFGARQHQIGIDIFPGPQIISFFLHELIAVEFMEKYPEEWGGEKRKDLTYLPDDFYSTEIKASSNHTRVFANRSYAQMASDDKKEKSGYYITVNFEDCRKCEKPKILVVRFGWLDHSDWIAQAAATGQQAHLAPITYQTKLVQLYPLE